MRHNAFLLFAVLAVIVFGAIPAHAQCLSSTIPTSVDGDLNKDINDWAIIYEDAKSTTCAGAARTALEAHLQSQALLGGWTSGFLQGGAESMAYAAGLVLAGKNQSSDTIDQLLRDTPYAMVKDASCGFSDVLQGGKERWRFANSCIDDWGVAAEGWAWRAAYMRKTGRAEWRTDRANAIFAIGMFFDINESICVYDSNQPLGIHGPCNSITSMIGQSGVLVLPFNHGAENPSYGIGMISSLANGFLGLEAAEDPVNIDLDFSTQKASDILAITTQLFAEAQRGSTSDGTAYVSTCFRAANKDATGDWAGFNTFRDTELLPANRTGSCTDNVFTLTPYLPWMFAVHEFFDAYQFTVPTNGFDFKGSSFINNEGSTFNTTDRTAFFGDFRREVYYTLSSDWFLNRGNRARFEGTGVYLISIKTNSGTNYLTAEGNGGSSVVADRTSAGWWETFRLQVMDGAGSLKDGDRVNLTTSDSWYFTALNGGNYSLLADTHTLGSRETFRVVKLADARGGNSHGPVISDSDVFALKSESTGTTYYVVAEGGGGGAVNVNRTAQGPWESFTLVRKESF
jgi:hypothetical protein